MKGEQPQTRAAPIEAQKSAALKFGLSGSYGFHDGVSDRSDAQVCGAQLNNAGSVVAARGKQSAEIEVGRENNVTSATRPSYDVSIWCLARADSGPVNRIMTSLAEERGPFRR